MNKDKFVNADPNLKPVSSSLEKEQINTAECNIKPKDDEKEGNAEDISIMNNQYSIMGDID
ncbi:hypothetical protein V7201_00465 [Bacillus sp. JJ1122]|uniref:hypothetical protein n=1 Tax=Bacillus sp. JJ1122 TaxID=3122951 RepID=UPI002FFEF3E5